MNSLQTLSRLLASQEARDAAPPVHWKVGDWVLERADRAGGMYQAKGTWLNSVHPSGMAIGLTKARDIIWAGDLPSLLMSSGLQPIETAPRDGTAIMLYAPNFHPAPHMWFTQQWMEDEGWGYEYQTGELPADGWFLTLGGDVAVEGFPCRNPTHWSPILKPEKTNDQ